MAKHANQLFIFSGEPSGDLHGSWLVRKIKKEFPDATLEGVAGPKMRTEGVKGPLNMEDFEVMGFSDVIKALPKIYKNLKKTLKYILDKQPDGVVLIDYPGFNLRLAKALRKNGFRKKIIHYISPSVWAWGKDRITEMASHLDLLLTIYPFEAACYKESTLNVVYAGSPLKEYIHEHHYDEEWQTKLKICPDKKMIGLFPGSRRAEIERNLPVILQAVSLILSENPSVIFGISCFHESVQSHLNKYLNKFPRLKEAFYFIPKNYTYELMRDSQCAIAKSGTVTLELALHQCPTVVVYQLSRLNRFYAQHILKVNLPYYCIANILAQKEVFPELIENGLNADNLFQITNSLLNEDSIRNSCIQSCNEISLSLGENSSSLKAAQEIMRVIQC